MRRPNRDGFTLVELMIVVAIIGILAAIAFPQFANMVAKAEEGVTKGNLGAIRSALSIYYSDNEGMKPGVTSAIGGGMSTLGLLSMGGKYLQGIPICYLPKTPNNIGHPPSTWETDINNLDGGGSMAWACKNGINTGQGFQYPYPMDPLTNIAAANEVGSMTTGGWVVVGNLDVDPSAPSVFILCTHQDIGGHTWSTY